MFTIDNDVFDVASEKKSLKTNQVKITHGPSFLLDSPAPTQEPFPGISVIAR